MSENSGEMTANIVNDDPLGMTERKISRVQDDIANAEMFGDDVTDAQRQELKGLEDMRDYLMSRDYKDDYGNIHDANNGRFRSLENANQKPEDLGERYEDMSLEDLISKWAESEDNSDRTSATNIQDEILRRLSNETNMNDDLKMRMIDNIHSKMMDRRKKDGSTDQPTPAESDPTSQVDNLEDDIDITTPGPEGDRNEFYVNEQHDTSEQVVEPEAATDSPSEDPAPVTESIPVNESDDKLKTVLSVNIEDNIRRAAENSARHQIEADKTKDDEKLEGKSRFRKAINSMVRGMTLSHRERTYRVDAERKLRESLDFIEQSVPVEARIQARQDLFNQFKSDIEGSIRDSDEVGEKRKELEDTHELAIGTKDLIIRYHRGEFRDDGAFEEARVRMIEDYRRSHPEEAKNLGIDKKAAEISDLVEIAKTAAGMVEHGESMDNILSNMSIVMGEARSDVNSQAKLNAVEKFYDKLSRSGMGSCVPGAVMLTGLSIGMSFGRYGGQSAISSATKLGVVSFAAGLFAGARKNMEYKKARAGFQIDEAKGETYDKDRDPLRAKMEDFSLRPESAKLLTETLNSLTSDEKLQSSPDAVRDAIGALADLEAKMKYSDKSGRDFLAFSNPAAIIRERLDLVAAISQAKSSINQYITPEMRNEMGVGVDDNMQQIVDKLSVNIVETLDDNLTSQDKAFNKLKRQEVTKAAVKGVVVGATLGVIMQEVGAAFDNTRVGLLEQLWHANNVASNGEVSKTLLAGAFGGTDIAKNVDISHINFDTTHIGEHATYGISGGNSIVDHGDGTLDIVGHNGNLADHVPINSDGSMSVETINNLRHSGLNIIDKSTNVDHITEVTRTISGNDFVDKHIGEMTQIHRIQHMDNDTVKFDLNELKTWWGGANNNGITSDGYQMSVSHMAAGGSFHDGDVLNAPGLIKEGQLQAAISVSHGTQNEVFMVPIDRAGNLNIDANSPVAKLFSTVDGHAQFNGGFVEIVRVENVDANGVPGVEVLSTVVGGNDVSIEVTDKITDHIFTPAYDIVPQQVEMPPVVFTESREQMGRTKVEYDQTPIVPEGYYGGYYGGERELTPEEIKERERETSPRLLDNPEARLVPGEEYDFYKKLLIEKRGQDYVAEIDKQVDQISELKAINNNTEAIITIPVNAAGKNEASSIYNILTKAYGGQDPDSLKKSVILLHLNWMDSYDNPDLARANIEKTKAEIERAKRDLGGKISIAVLETEFKRSDIKNSGVIGHVVRRMNDAAIMALDKAVDEGRMDTNHETLIIRNDADLIGMRKNYLKRYVDDFSDDNIADVYLGTTSFDQTNADRAPGLVLAGNIMQMASIISRDRENVVHTAGGNFGIRASSLAAIGGIGFGEYTGAGSDDVEVGRRMSMVRSGRIRVKNDGSYSALNQTEVNNRIGKTVHGARLDLNASRGEKEYINNRSVAGQWSDNKFDKDGYSDRDLGVDGSFSESLKDTPEDVLSRIENNIEGVININRPTLSTIRSTLAFTFPSSDCYVLKADNSGIYSFSLTSKGKKYLKNNLSGASTGKSYGQRKREWYGDNGKQSSMIRI